MKAPIRFILSSGIFLCLAALLTSAMITQWQSSSVLLQGEQNTLRIAAIGNAQLNWTPTIEDWNRHTGRSYTVELAENSITPDHPLKLRMAVRNESPLTATSITLSLRPTPIPGRNPADGEYLFNQLAVTVKQGQTTIAQDIPATQLAHISLPETLISEEYAILDVQIRLTPQHDEEWIDKKTGLEFQFIGTNT
ncbi:hypothetical protein [Lysinibacter sp. HNR]|uniref:hypothetical protein n=1 Tax=Lysinibacter sp. HNR TaxID=3031408 RepID=UPI002434AE39|nr:hypothetical protein [Lysinibacter sp. HNR]WGD37921.1 hypothetical protein FrondiHNR_03125 [Lysinibacter sp. HNR]